MASIDSFFPAEFEWSHAADPFEKTTEIVQIRNAAAFGDLGNRNVAAPQKISRICDPGGHQELAGTAVHLPFEQTGQRAPVASEHITDRIHIDFGIVVLGLNDLLCPFRIKSCVNPRIVSAARECQDLVDPGNDHSLYERIRVTEIPGDFLEQFHRARPRIPDDPVIAVGKNMPDGILSAEGQPAVFAEVADHFPAALLSRQNDLNIIGRQEMFLSIVRHFHLPLFKPQNGYLARKLRALIRRPAFFQCVMPDSGRIEGKEKLLFPIRKVCINNRFHGRTLSADCSANCVFLHQIEYCFSGNFTL